MTLIELLSTLRARDINVWAEGERLRYSAASGALTPDIREELATHKAALLTFLNETDRRRRVTRAPITKISREEKLLPSINQRRFWFIHQLQSNTAFNCYEAFRINGLLKIASLEQSLSEIVRRHEALRTTFPAIDGEPIQVVNSALALKLALVDLRHIVDATERETEAERIMAEEVEKPFDLATGPLFRTYLFQLDADEHLLLITLHHIVSDSWSMGILFKELTVLYDAFYNGNPSPLPELPIQYVDFAHWQSEWLHGEVLQQELDFWKERLKGAPDVTDLPTDYPRPPVQNFRGASEPIAISKSLTEALKALSKNHGVTLFMTLLAAFKTLLYRHSGQEDLVLGSPIAGRTRGEIEGLIGLFMNVLVLRTDLSGNPTFRELLRRVSTVALDAYAHQEVPFEKLIGDLQFERSLSFSSLFQVMFVLLNTPESKLSLLGSTVSPVTIKQETAPLDLFLTMEEGRGGLHGTLSYRTDLFDRVTINNVIRRFEVLLHGIVADPDRPISTLPFLTEAEKHQVLLEWNNTEKDYAKDKCLQQLFEEQVERTPDAVAVVCGDRRLTYRELNGRANMLAHYLRKHGVGPEVPVGIYMERSVEVIVGLFAVLKSGGAYVPLDPNYPMERLRFMLQDTCAPILLTQQRIIKGRTASESRYSISLLDGLKALDSQSMVIALDSDWKKFIDESMENPQSGAGANNVAYVIYTSGSTGNSKGVMVTHRSLLNAYLAWEDIYQLRHTTTVHLQMASFSFDVFSGDCMRALCSGKKLVLCPTEFLLDASALYRLMLCEQVDCAEFVPAVMRNLCQYLEESGETLDFMHILIVGSETWCVEEFKKVRRLCGPNTQVINSYGLTEATIDSSYFRGRVQGSIPNRSVPIGKPFPNTQFYVLDGHLQPVPVGVAGELHVGGAGLARGYLNRPDLTAEKFIPHPFNSNPGEYLYKTGDLVRYLPDGNIEFIGRLDNQIKIRGCRMELGEIEAVLGSHPAVRETLVTAWDASPEASYVPNSSLSQGRLHKIDQTNARNDFIQGKMQYFSFVEVTEENIFYGNTGMSFNQYDDYLSNSPYNGAPFEATYLANGTINFTPLILADLRHQGLTTQGLGGTTGPSNRDFVFPDVVQGARNVFFNRRMKDAFNLKKIFTYYDYYVEAFSTPNLVGQYNFPGYDSSPQMVRKLLCDAGLARIVPFLYTPIVLDLGNPHVRTSSYHWGAYFNLANGRIRKDGVPQDPKVETFSHQTAWLGGWMKQVNAPITKVGGQPEKMWVRRAEDAFLLFPNADGKAYTAEDLFGSHTKVNVNGTTTTFANGFLALQAYAGTATACASPPREVAPVDAGSSPRVVPPETVLDVTERYIGPWNPKYSLLKVWIDANRNGVVDTGETKGLAEAKIGAINTCLTTLSNFEEEDQYGNETKLRSAFLYVEDSPLSSKLSNPNADDIAEIKARIATGKMPDGTPVLFRLMVDIYFQAVTSSFLEKSMEYRMEKNPGQTWDISIPQ